MIRWEAVAPLLRERVRHPDPIAGSREEEGFADADGAGVIVVGGLLLELAHPTAFQRPGRPGADRRREALGMDSQGDHAFLGDAI